MERRDLYQDDLTEERYPSPARRDDASSTLVLDPDNTAIDSRSQPRATVDEPDDEDDDEEDEDEDDEEEV